MNHQFYLQPGRRWFQLLRFLFWLFAIYILLSSSFRISSTSILWTTLLTAFFVIAAFHDAFRFFVWNQPFLALSKTSISFRSFFGLKQERILLSDILSIRIRNRLKSTPLIILRFRKTGTSRQRIHVIWLSDYSDQKEIQAILSNFTDWS